MAESQRKFDQDFKEGAVRSPSESPARRHHDRDRGSPISGAPCTARAVTSHRGGTAAALPTWRICPRQSTEICRAARLNGPLVQSQ